MKTILSKQGHFVISGPDKTKRWERVKEDEKVEIFIQSVQFTKPSLYDLGIAIVDECFSNINHEGLDLETKSIIVHLRTSDGKEYDFDIENSTSLDDIWKQILGQINI